MSATSRLCIVCSNYSLELNTRKKIVCSFNMTKIQSSILKLYYLLLLVKFVFSDDIKFKSKFFDIRQIRNEVHAIKNDFNFPNAIISTFHNWTNNRACFVELNAIENGIRNSDEWAIKSMSLSNVYFWFH